MVGSKRAGRRSRGEVAPIALFVHARPEHTKRALDALATNRLATDTPLFIFADAARNPQEQRAVDAVRAIVAAASGFSAVTVLARETNYGLARNIVEGVTQLVEQYGKVIVLEDDLVTGPHFLEFMNGALDRYADDPQVWHINGWTYPIDRPQDARPFFTPVMECWGWATWRDRWSHNRKDATSLLARKPEFDIHRFNIGGGYDYWSDIERNAHGIMNTWAVFWYATIFERGGLCLSPPKSHVVNIGIDGSGTNSGTSDIFALVTAADAVNTEWPIEVFVDESAWEEIRDFLLSHRPPLWRRAARWLRWTLKRMRRQLTRTTK